MNLTDLLNFSISQGATDVFFAPKAELRARIAGEIIKLDEASLTFKKECLSLLTQTQLKDLEENKFTTFCLEFSQEVFFRVHLSYSKGELIGSFRKLPKQIPTLETLGIPVHFSQLIERKKGLILICGPGSSGKTTTLASLVEHINQNQSKHILTLEDSIEYEFESKKSFITQVELGKDVWSVKNASKSLHHQNVDTTVFYDLNHFDDFDSSLHLASTGQLVIASLTAASIEDALLRFLNESPTQYRKNVGARLGSNLLGVIYQELLPDESEKGRVLGYELFIPTIEEQIHVSQFRIQEIRKLIQNDTTGFGSKSYNKCLFELLLKRNINLKTAFAFSPNPEELDQFLKRAGF